MANVEPSLLANSIMAKVYDILTNGDDSAPKSEDNFFSFMTPGYPVQESDFDFLTQGLTGVVRKVALDEMRSTTAPAGDPANATTAPAPTPAATTASTSTTTAPPPPPPPASPVAVPTPAADTTSQPALTPALLEQLRAQDAARLQMQAEGFARLVDFVPDLASVTNNQFARLSIMNNEGTLSERYERVLRLSQVMQSQLPDDTKAKIEKFRGLLTVSKVKKSLLDDSETTVTEPSPLVQAYNDKLAAYEAAALDYNSHRIDALAANDARSVQYWALNANILRNRVKSAMTDWVTNGYKEDYEQIGAYIDQVMLRDMSLLKELYRDDLEKAKLTGLASGSDFYFTSAPGNFTKAAGWTEFSFNSADFERYKTSSYNYSSSSSRGGGGMFGIFGGSASHQSSSGEAQSHAQFDSDQFHLKFEIAQVPIVRPWFKTSFLMSKTWRFDQSDPEAKSEVLSDGGTPAKGLLPAYPTSLICIRNLVMYVGNSSGVSDAMSSYEQSGSGAGGYVSFGSFFLGGAHSSISGSGEQSSKVDYHHDSQTINVPGLQVIGFKCHVLPKSPNPLPGITAWI